MASDQQLCVFLLVNKVISKANDSYPLIFHGSEGAGIYIDRCIRTQYQVLEFETEVGRTWLYLCICYSAITSLD